MPATSHADEHAAVRAPDRRVLKAGRNHSHALPLYFVFYNFVRIHWTFRTSPAMTTGPIGSVMEE
jgi:hypothetical protein